MEEVQVGIVKPRNDQGVSEVAHFGGGAAAFAAHERAHVGAGSHGDDAVSGDRDRGGMRAPACSREHAGAFDDEVDMHAKAPFG